MKTKDEVVYKEITIDDILYNTMGEDEDVLYESYGDFPLNEENLDKLYIQLLMTERRFQNICPEYRACYMEMKAMQSRIVHIERAKAYRVGRNKAFDAGYEQGLIDGRRQAEKELRKK